MTNSVSRVRSHRDLLVWQRELELVDETYRCTDQFPQRERYEVTAQMRAAAISIPANIAEGHARHTPREFLRFLAIANGSLQELDTYYEIGLRRKHATASDPAKMRALIDEVGRVMSGLRTALKRKTLRAPDPQSLTSGP